VAGILWQEVRTAPPVGQTEKKAPREAIRNGTVAAAWRQHWREWGKGLCMIGGNATTLHDWFRRIADHG